MRGEENSRRRRSGKALKASTKQTGEERGKGKKRKFACQKVLEEKANILYIEKKGDAKV